MCDNQSLELFRQYASMIRNAERELLLNSLPGMAYRCSVLPPWPMEYVSSGVRYLSSFSAEDITSRRVTWGELIDPHDLPLVEREVALAVAEERQFTLTYRIHDPKLGERWLLERGAAVYEAGAATALIGFIMDITEQKLVERRLREAEERYALAARATGDIIWDWDLNSGQLRRIAPPGNSLGYSTRELNDDPRWWEERVHPDDADRVQKGVEVVLTRSSKYWTDRYRLRKANGDYAHIVDRGFLTTESGTTRRMVGAMQDVSSQVAADEKLAELQAQLVHLAGVSAMGTMANTLAHELNQPLVASASFLSGSRRLLEALHGSRKEEVENGLVEAERQVQRAGEIIRRMRDMLANNEPNKEVVSLQVALRRVTRLMEAGSLSPITIRSSIEAGADRVLADQIQVEQVLLNLLRNAVEAMVATNGQEALVAAKRVEGGMVEVEVRDQGCGLGGRGSELFSAFSPSTKGGMGVGLSISRTIIEAHGGRIRATDNPAGGASFYFTIPVAAR